MMPSHVKEKDLKADITQDESFKFISETMATYIKHMEAENGEELSSFIWKLSDDASDFFKPFVDGMQLEGSYNLKIPCYNKNLVNPDSPHECMRGSPWSTQAQLIMAGSTADEHVSMYTFDNFHRVYVTTPHHLPQINNTCPESGPHPCKLEGLTVTELYYHRFSSLDFGTDPQAAIEQKAKLISRQMIQWHAGHTDANFTKLDDNS